MILRKATDILKTKLGQQIIFSFVGPLRSLNFIVPVHYRYQCQIFFTVFGSDYSWE